MALFQVEVPYKKGYDFGIGVDLASGSPMGKAVSSAYSGVEKALGATTQFEVTRIHSTSDLETKLGIDAKASYGSGAFYGVSGRLNYARSSKIQTTSLFMAITASIELAFDSIDQPALSPEAAGLVSRPDVFISRYGNMFVRGIGRGGLFVGVLQIDTFNSEDSESIASELEGSYGLFSSEAKEKFDQLRKKYHCEVHVSLYHEGGPIDLAMKDVTDPAELYGLFQLWLKSFQDHPDDNARPYYVTLAPLSIAQGPLPPNAAEIQHAQDVLVICAKQRTTIIDGLNLMDHIVQNPARYEYAAPTTPSDIVKAFTGYQEDLELIEGAASQALSDVTKAVSPAEFARQTGKLYPQGVPPTPMPTMAKGLTDSYAARGEAIARTDALIAALRNSEPEGPSRAGFDKGIAVCESDTLWGPGKQSLLDSLPVAEQLGFHRAAMFSLQRNNNADLAAKGEAIVKTDPALATARALEPAGTSWLGFDIATALFGNPALGAKGNTQTGPGSAKIRQTLDADGQRGFDAALAIHLSRKYR